ncbi:MAG: hypothetical protein J2P26_07925, partial [Nocardiopsaceae bacterium]|nr:hypothetical protein [Nocardiopsaceae bacterium]
AAPAISVTSAAPAAPATGTLATGTLATGVGHPARYPAETRSGTPTRPGTPDIPGRGGSASGGGTSQATSTNWSGYAATGRSFTSVSASWVQPSVSCGSGRGYSSFWVGLDGYASKTVEQIGTDSDCSGRPQYYGWWEMYPGASHNFPKAIGPGDRIRASVVYSASAGSYRLTLSDESRKWSTAVTRTLPGAQRNSAEVVVEAPSDGAGVLPLAHFAPASISDAQVNGAAIGRYGPTKITMTNDSGADKDTVSPLTGGESFHVTWQRSN